MIPEKYRFVIIAQIANGTFKMRYAGTLAANVPPGEDEAGYLRLHLPGILSGIAKDRGWKCWRLYEQVPTLIAES